MEVKDRVETFRSEILQIASQYGARNVRLFGSVARGDDTPCSDVDILVEMEPGRSLLDLSGLILDLRDLLGCDVDVVTDDSLHWYIRDRVLGEAVPL